ARSGQGIPALHRTPPPEAGRAHRGGGARRRRRQRAHPRVGDAAGHDRDESRVEVTRPTVAVRGELRARVGTTASEPHPPPSKILLVLGDDGASGGIRSSQRARSPWRTRQSRYPRTPDISPLNTPPSGQQPYET